MRSSFRLFANPPRKPRWEKGRNGPAANTKKKFDSVKFNDLEVPFQSHDVSVEKGASLKFSDESIDLSKYVTPKKPKKFTKTGDRIPRQNWANKGKVRKFAAQAKAHERKPLITPSKLFDCIKSWTSDQQNGDQLLLGVEKEERHVVKQDLKDFFANYAKLAWLIERKEEDPADPDFLFGCFMVMFRGIDGFQAGKMVRTSKEEAKKIGSRLIAICEEGLEHEDMPNHVRLECPRVIYERLRARFRDKEELENELSALNGKTDMQIRVNLLKSTSEEVVQKLKEQNIEATKGRFNENTLYITGDVHLAQTKEFKEGYFEVQDEGSQLVSLMVDVSPKMNVLDMCAGAGGKSLALSSLMNNKGHIVASDVNLKRLNRSRVRFARNGCVNVERVFLSNDDATEKFFESKKMAFDRVLIDAPCSGVGAWRKNPENKWKHDVGESITRLIELQDDLLYKAKDVVAESGRIVYATCSLLGIENESRVEQFLSENQDFQLVKAKEVWGKVMKCDWPCKGEDYLQLTPYQHNTDGFFAAILERKT